MFATEGEELWVIDQFVNPRWFRGKFQLEVRWKDQTEEQDDWRDYFTILVCWLATGTGSRR
jgi:hypothetical protein